MLIPTLILITFIVLRLFREMVEKFMSLKVSWNDSIISWKLIEINARKKLPARNIPSPETQSCPDFRSNRLRRSIDLIFFSLAILVDNTQISSLHFSSTSVYHVYQCIYSYKKHTEENVLSGSMEVGGILI